MSVDEIHSFYESVKKHNMRVAEILLSGKKLATLIEFCALTEASFGASKTKSLLEEVAIKLRKKDSEIVELFWDLLERRVRGVDGEGQRLTGSGDLAESAMTWLGSWAVKNGIDDLELLQIYGEWDKCEIEPTMIIECLFSAIPTTDNLALVLENLVASLHDFHKFKKKCDRAEAELVDSSDGSDGISTANIVFSRRRPHHQKGSKQKEKDKTAVEMDADGEEEKKNKKKMTTTTKALLDGEEDAFPLSLKKRKADQQQPAPKKKTCTQKQTKTPMEIEMDDHYRVIGEMHKMLFDQIVNSPLLRTDVAGAVKDLHAEAKAKNPKPKPVPKKAKATEPVVESVSATKPETVFETKAETKSKTIPEIEQPMTQKVDLPSKIVSESDEDEDVVTIEQD